MAAAGECPTRVDEQAAEILRRGKVADAVAPYLFAQPQHSFTGCTEIDVGLSELHCTAIVADTLVIDQAGSLVPS